MRIWVIRRRCPGQLPLQFPPKRSYFYGGQANPVAFQVLRRRVIIDTTDDAEPQSRVAQNCSGRTKRPGWHETRNDSVSGIFDILVDIRALVENVDSPLVVYKKRGVAGRLPADLRGSGYSQRPCGNRETFLTLVPVTGSILHNRNHYISSENGECFCHRLGVGLRVRPLCTVRHSPHVQQRSASRNRLRPGLGNRFISMVNVADLDLSRRMGI
jgi:hypothetical protein